MKELAFCSATELAARVSSGENSALELCDYFISRIETYDDDINAVVVRDFERARASAALADQQPMENRGKLHGVPMTIKESFDIAGLPTTWGLSQFSELTAKKDAVVVQSLKSEGAIFLGKTNVPANLADFQSYNDVYGQTNNPWDVSRVPGGSSGGAAAALAAGLTSLEIGSDIGGSIRNPAHFCGVYGLKPSWGVVPQNGHALPGSLASADVAVCGPLARSAQDLTLAMDVISGPEPLNRAAWKLQLPLPKKKRLKDFKIAVWSSDAMAPVDDTIRTEIEALANILEKTGATVSRSARPAIDVRRSHITYLNLMHSIMGAAVGQDFYEATQLSAQSLDEHDNSDAAHTIRAMVLSHRQWLSANNFRERLRYQWQEFFNDWDILLCPQMATTAFEHDHSRMSERRLHVNGQPHDYFQQVFWSGLASVSYLPSTVFPIASSNGLPIGVQAMGGEFCDLTTTAFAQLVEQEIGAYNTPPAFS